MSSPQLDNLEPQDLVQYTRTILISATAEYAEATAIVAATIAVVCRENISRQRGEAEDIHETAESMDAFAREAMVSAKACQDEIVAATASRRTINMEVQATAVTVATQIGVVMGSLNGLVTEQVVTDALERLSRVRQRYTLATEANEAATRALSWMNIPLSTVMTELMRERAITAFRTRAITTLETLANLDRLHQQQMMVTGRESDSMSTAETGTGGIANGLKFIKRRTRKNSKKTKRRRQKFAKRVRGTKRRK